MQGIQIISSSSEWRHHDNIRPSTDLVVLQFLHLIHLLTHVDQLELINRHPLLMLDILLQHPHSVLLLVCARQLPICDSSDLQCWHYDIDSIIKITTEDLHLNPSFLSIPDPSLFWHSGFKKRSSSFYQYLNIDCYVRTQRTQKPSHTNPRSQWTTLQHQSTNQVQRLQNCWWTQHRKESTTFIIKVSPFHWENVKCQKLFER